MASYPNCCTAVLSYPGIISSPVSYRHCLCDIGFQAAYSQLAFAGKVEMDPCSEVHDVKALLAKSLAALCATQPDVSTQHVSFSVYSVTNQVIVTLIVLTVAVIVFVLFSF